MTDVFNGLSKEFRENLYFKRRILELESELSIEKAKSTEQYLEIKKLKEFISDDKQMKQVKIERFFQVHKTIKETEAENLRLKKSNQQLILQIVELNKKQDE